MKDLFGIPVIESPNMAPGRALLVEGRLLVGPGYLQDLLWKEEIRSIVRNGIKKAHPWLFIPRKPRRSDHDSGRAMDVDKHAKSTLHTRLPRQEEIRR